MDPRLYASAEPNPAPASDPANARAAADAVRDAHQLLGAYPFASATPTYPGSFQLRAFFSLLTRDAL
jgi:hypothetical protein